MERVWFSLYRSDLLFCLVIKFEYKYEFKFLLKYKKKIKHNKSLYCILNSTVKFKFIYDYYTSDIIKIAL